MACFCSFHPCALLTHEACILLRALVVYSLRMAGIQSLSLDSMLFDLYRPSLCSPGVSLVSIICVSGGTSLAFVECLGIIHQSLKRARDIIEVAFGRPTFHVRVEARSFAARGNGKKPFHAGKQRRKHIAFLIYPPVLEQQLSTKLQIASGA